MDNLLRQHIAIVLPSTIGLNKPLPKELHDREFKALTNFMSWWFKGVTAIPSVGGHLSEVTKEVIVENTHIFISFSEELDDVDVEIVLLYANGIKNRLQQESVSVLVNGGLLFLQ
jgi:hypothetical protein